MMGKMKIEYTKSKHYMTVPATGIAGCISPTGLVQCDLYTEKANITTNHEIEIAENGQTLPSQMIVETFTRELQSSFLLTPEVANSIGQWLIKIADEAKIANNMKVKKQ